jgi:subtilisin family serine protease
VIVAILDTGVDVSHPDLQGRIWSNPNEVAGNGVDDDANGCVDDVNGCAFVTFPEPGCRQALGGDVADDIGHGTFVSGIVAANGDDAGMVGVARGATVLPVKVLDCEGSGNSLELAQGIFYAAKNGARILNVSLGGPTDPLIVREAVRVAAEEYGALVVAASGNSGGEGVAYPARYPQALAVGAASVADPGARASFSTAGPEVDVVAIGEGIIGTVPPEMCGIFAECIGGHHAAGDGTSFAAPQVAGLVALLLSRRPSLTPQAIVDHLRATADPVREPGNWAGAGRVNMLETVQPPFRLGVPGTARD